MIAKCLKSQNVGGTMGLYLRLVPFQLERKFLWQLSWSVLAFREGAVWQLEINMLESEIL